MTIPHGGRTPAQGGRPTFPLAWGQQPESISSIHPDGGVPDNFIPGASPDDALPYEDLDRTRSYDDDDEKALFARSTTIRERA